MKNTGNWKCRIIETTDFDLPWYEELNSSPIERVGINHLAAVREIKCWWKDSMTMADYLVGWTEKQSSGGDITYFRGHEYPHTLFSRMGSTWLTMRCTSVQIRPFGKVYGTGIQYKQTDYDHSILTCTYENAAVYPIDDIVKEHIEPGLEYLTRSPKGFYWDAGQTKPLEDTEAPSQIIPMKTWVYSIYNVPTFKDMSNYEGKSNSKVIYSDRLRMYFGIGTLLLATYEIEEIKQRVGLSAYNLHYHFVGNPLTWNKFKRPNGSSSFLYDSAGDPVVLYEPVDLNDLLLVEG